MRSTEILRVALSEEEEAVEDIHTGAEDGANEEIPNELTASWVATEKATGNYATRLV